MTYNDEQYVQASLALTSAVGTLLENEISEDDIQEMVETAIDDWKADQA